MAETATRRTKQPPARGRPYYDANRGQKMIVPKEGGKAVPYIGPKERQGFDARTVLRRTGVRAKEETRSTVRTARRAGRTIPSVAPAGGFGGFVIYLLGSIVGLALLEALVGGRGPAAYSKILGGLGGGFKKLLDPSDPLVPAAPPASAGTTTSGPTIASATSIPGGGGVGAATAQSPARAPSSGRRTLVTLPASVTTRAGIQIDQRVQAEIVAITRMFGVKVSSGYRSPAQNAAAGGASNSDHLRGDAADFVGTPAQIRALYAWALKQHFPYVEPMSQAQDHVHISFIR